MNARRIVCVTRRRVTSSCCVPKSGSQFGTRSLVRRFGRRRGCPSTGPLRWTSRSRDISRRQRRRRTSFCTLRLAYGLYGRSNNFKKARAFFLNTSEWGKGNLAMNITANRSCSLRREGFTIGGLQDWNKTPWKIDRVLGLVTTLSLRKWHLICGPEVPLHLKFWAMWIITVYAMWWTLARRTMSLLAIGCTNCFRHRPTMLLSMFNPLTLKTAQGIWNILPH